MINDTPVILCVGSGTRLWPVPLADFPKHFICLTGNESLFQQAAQRLVGLGAGDIEIAKPYIVTRLYVTKREEHSLHRKVHHPSGRCRSIDEGGRLKVNRLLVKPMASLSLHKHIIAPSNGLWWQVGARSPMATRC